MKRIVAVLILFFGLYPLPRTLAGTDTTSAITGTAYQTLVTAQKPDFQKFLATIVDEKQGFVITGPLDALFRQSPGKNLFHSHRIICPDMETLQVLLERIFNDSLLAVIESQICLMEDCPGEPVGYRGALLKIKWQESEVLLQLNTIQQTRWLIWAYKFLNEPEVTIPHEKWGLYASSLSQHLYAAARHWDDFPAPQALTFGLPGRIDFYLEPPRKIIRSEGIFKQMLADNRGIYSDFAKGLNSFIPGDSLLNKLKENATAEAYPNKNTTLLQHQYSQFMDGGGHLTDMQTLSKEVFDNLESGEYFFAVGLSGKIRFGKNIATESGSDSVNADSSALIAGNQAFLFPGEPVLTAGFFTVEQGSPPRLVTVNVYSEPYFYSNYCRDIEDNISRRSNHYLLTLGHFFKALDRLGIACDGISISKF